MDSRSEPELFNERSLQILTHLAHIVAIKMENRRLFDETVRARELDQQLRSAAAIQNQFLPSETPRIEGYRLDAFNRPSFGVGGDFFNYFSFDDGRFGIALGDVAGNGLPASLLMCSFQVLLATQWEGPVEPDLAMQRVNRFLCRQIPVNRFITAFLAILDPRTDSLTYASAGQNHPLLVSPAGEVTELKATGLPLGIADGASYGTGRVSMLPGSSLLAYSDGLTELPDPSGEEFGEARLREAALSLRDASLEEIRDGIVKLAEQHAGDVGNEDDITFLILQRDR